MRSLRLVVAVLGVALIVVVVLLALRGSDLQERRERIDELEAQTREAEKSLALLQEELRAAKAHGEFRYRMGIGTAFVKERSWPRAIEAFERALEASPDEISAVFFLGVCHHNRGALSEAREAFKRVIASSDPSFDGHFYRGCAYQRMRRTGDAIASYTRALGIKPDDGGVLFNRGEVHFMAGDLPAARRDFEAALKLDPESAQVKAMLAQVEAAQRQGR